MNDNDAKLPDFAFYRSRTRTQNSDFLLLFLNLETFRCNSTSEEVANIIITWITRRKSAEVWSSRNSFKKKTFHFWCSHRRGCLSSVITWLSTRNKGRDLLYLENCFFSSTPSIIIKIESFDNRLKSHWESETRWKIFGLLPFRKWHIFSFYSGLIFRTRSIAAGNKKELK